MENTKQIKKEILQSILDFENFCMLDANQCESCSLRKLSFCMQIFPLTLEDRNILKTLIEGQTCEDEVIPLKDC